MRIALFNLGFRPFFLAAPLFAVIAMLFWFGFFLPGWPLPSYTRSPIAWHAHEMVFGYAVAVIAGFLLTAARNWTQRPTANGWRLALLLSAWAAARVLALPSVEAPVWTIAVLDCTFGLALCVAIAVPIVKSRLWPQLGVVSKLALVVVSNGLFYLGLLLGDMQLSWWGVYCGMYLVLSLVLMFGRRVIPSFIERGVGYPVQLRNARWVDATLLILFLVYSVLDVFSTSTLWVSALAGLLFVLHTWRLVGWHTRGLWRKPLLWVLYCAYASIVIGFALKSMVPIFSVSPSLAVHAFTYGGIGIMTAGMMARVALGHTGRDVHRPPAFLRWVFALLLTGAGLRVLAPVFSPALYLTWVGIAQALWILAFSLLLVIYVPILLRPRIDGQPG